MRPSEAVNLHPSTHHPSTLPFSTFDVIFIGSGWAPRIATPRLVREGISCLVIESELVGGECPFWACAPSKALLRPQEALSSTASVGGARERLQSDHGVEVLSTFRRRDGFTGAWDDLGHFVPAIESAGGHVTRGHAKILAPKKVEVTPHVGDPVELEANLAVVIGTGSEAVMPDIPGLLEANPWTPRDATSSKSVPEHLIVMGGGAVGAEMATAYLSFGAKITLVHSSPEILPAIDAPAGKLVREALEKSGAVVRVRARITEVQRGPDQRVKATLSDGSTITGSELLVAAGRTGRHRDLGLDNVGLAPKGRWIDVDDDLKVKGIDGDWLYAVGDVNGRALFSHSSKYHGRAVANTIIAKAKGQIAKGHGIAWPLGKAHADNVATPQVIFTNPSVGSVGLTRKAAEKKGIEIREVVSPSLTFGGMVRADGQEPGWAQWILDKEDRILGATFVGTEAEDLLHANTVAVVGGMTVQQMAHAIPCFPTMSEVYLNLCDAAGI
ncbi:hypothetical protein KC343_g8917 [Hortaea werneckii]|nr:hypothetical protein KC352_g10806 [Hortaea werneckii]KAI7561301.1 hypothetical protein KC317_g9155 [Hortaea werneckii]KAI7608657.1 hypothetical protein KC346_g9523 [Hortaea werneckii]KAI7618922.1 hypothetical protein KC343_g8917 [Hortaea werneckii]KAI7658945.1 hypothetical protein KC319_g9099 [Hortaea werneckii]